MANSDLPRMNHVEERLRRLAEDVRIWREAGERIANQVADLQTLAQPQAWRLLMRTDRRFMREMLEAGLPMIRKLLDEEPELRERFVRGLSNDGQARGPARTEG